MDKDEEEFIPLDPKRNDPMKISAILYVRDADPYYNNNEKDVEDKLVPIPEDTYDELGRVVMPLKEIVEKADTLTVLCHELH